VTAANLPFEVVTHLYPSRDCQVDKLVRFASTFGNLLCSRLSAVNGICNGIGENVKYQFEISDALTSTFHPVTERAGVCRDFPH
jgi:transglutaminase-like putative cysteine protease